MGIFYNAHPDQNNKEVQKMAKKTEYEMRLEILDGITKEEQRLKEQLMLLELSKSANFLALWACPEMQDEEGNLKPSVQTDVALYKRNVTPQHDRETILANADAEKAAKVIWDNQAEATRAKEKLNESDYAAIFATIPDGKKLEVASRLEEKVVYSTTVKD